MIKLNENPFIRTRFFPYSKTITGCGLYVELSSIHDFSTQYNFKPTYTKYKVRCCVSLTHFSSSERSADGTIET